MKEEWKNIAGFKGRYQVSDLGRVRSFAIIRQRRNYNSIDRPRILSPSPCGAGYPTVILCDGRSNRTACMLHRLVAATFLGPIPEGRWIHHKDGDKTNNQLGNLEIVTPSANARAAVNNGSLVPPHLLGSKHGRAKLTEEDVVVIRASYIRGSATHGYAALGRRYSVGKTTVRQVIKRETWRHVS